MKIAVPFENEQIFQHFGKTEKFKIYHIKDGKIMVANIIGTNGNGHSALADILKNEGITVLICGGMGGCAKEALSAAGIAFYGGVTGFADKAVEAFLADKLNYNPDVKCNHHGDHHHDNHSCQGKSHK